MNFFDFDNIKAITSGKWIRRPDAMALKSPPNGVSIDTREDLTGKVFIAIKGEKHDGHDFLDIAARQGARLLIVEAATAARPPAVEGAAVLQVDDTRAVLARLATAYRRTLTATKVIAITGSSGKTTTKRIINSILATRLTGTSAPRSFNNDIGVPLTILSARPGDRYLVVEVGTNAPGEIGRLSKIAEPDIAVITLIGRAHLAGLGSIAGVAREKASLLSHLRSDGLAILTADSPELRGFARLALSVVFFGEAADAELRLTNRGCRKAGEAHPAQLWWFEVNGRTRFDFALPGKHNALNAIAAVAVARRMGIPDEAINEGLRAVRPEAMRMCLERVGDLDVCNDAYNANPESMTAALETFVDIAQDAPRRIVIFGDMLELGADAPQLHAEIGRKLIELDRRVRIDHAVFIGELCAHAADALASSWPPDRFTTIEQLSADTMPAVLAHLHPGDAVLFKASRGMALERVIEGLRKSRNQEVKESTGAGASVGA